MSPRRSYDSSESDETTTASPDAKRPTNHDEALKAGYRVSQAHPLCRVCGGSGKQPGTTSGLDCAACLGFGREGAAVPGESGFTDYDPGAVQAP